MSPDDRRQKRKLLATPARRDHGARCIGKAASCPRVTRRSVGTAELTRLTRSGLSTAAYSITSSAVARRDAGTLRPSTLAVWALMTSSNLLACTTGRSAGLAPL